MRTNSTTHPKGATACAMALLALAAVAAPASAAPLSAPPNTTPYNLSSRPMISGTVVAVNDREMVVDTDQGHQITLEMDSHTSAPRDLAPGMVMRTEFKALENCRLYAQRVTPMRGVTSVASLERHQAYANTRDEVIEENALASTRYRREHGITPANARPRVTEIQFSGYASNAVPAAAPTTANHGYSSRPMITGSVVSVNDHHVVVTTDQGQKVGLAMDSYTMIPGDVGPGSIVRIDFKRMRDGRYYAKGVHGITEGMLDREQAYAHTRDSEFLLAQNVDDCWSSAGGSATATSASSQTSYDATTAENQTTDDESVAVNENGQTATDENAAGTTDAGAQATADESAQAQAGEEPESLPRTASNRPVILLFGAIALGAAAMLIIRRRFFTA